MPEPPEPLRRNLEFERDLVHLAARGVADPEPFLDRCEFRSIALSGEYVSDPMHIAPGRDRDLDVLEELEDAVNHRMWAAWERNQRGEEDWEAVEDIRDMLRAWWRITCRRADV